MSRRSRSSGVRLHRHCESCFSRCCRAPVEVSVSCVIIPCRLLCGALFHLCKEEEHALLCPNERVPCLNRDYGCPGIMPRSWQASHLQVCPASIVCCSMEWIRWPADCSHTYRHSALQENVLKEVAGQEKALDLAMALDDQRQLYARMKMMTLYPELMEEEKEKEEEGAKGGHINEVLTHDGGLPQTDPSPTLGENSVRGEEGKNGVEEVSSGGISTEQYNRWERMFSMEKGGCKNASKPGEEREGKKGREEVTGREGREGREEQGGSESRHPETGGAVGNSAPVDYTKKGLAPWQDGVLDRLREEVSGREFNMYLVHHGRMLLNFGQIEACTPRERDFVYGSLEPIPVQTLHSFKVPTSYHDKRRTHQFDKSVKVVTEERGVDTSDLGGGEEGWMSDEAATTLLGYAEKEVMGHKISESVGIDGLFVEEGTQTHTFRTAPFRHETTLADVTVDRPLKLLLQLETDRVSTRNNKASSAFTFLCGHTFQRREYPKHFRNVHSDIQTCVNGWFEQRCPLAYLGCTYNQRRFQPSTHTATVSYNQELSIFNLRPCLPASLGEGTQTTRNPQESLTTDRKRGRRGGGGEDLLSALPYEVLCHMVSFLDSLSLSQLALVSRLMREVCSSLLHERGMVTLNWEKKTYSHGGAKWRAKTVWEFSHLFSTVEGWHFADVPTMSDHLRVCPYYQTSARTEAVALPSMSESQGGSLERQRLVTQFMGNR